MRKHVAAVMLGALVASLTVTVSSAYVLDVGRSVTVGGVTGLGLQTGSTEIDCGSSSECHQWAQNDACFGGLLLPVAVTFTQTAGPDGGVCVATCWHPVYGAVARRPACKKRCGPCDLSCIPGPPWEVPACCTTPEGCPSS